VNPTSPLLEKMVQLARARVGEEASPRLLAETALQFANSGMDDQGLFQDLACAARVALQETRSVRGFAGVKIAAKFAAAGVHDPLLYADLADCVLEHVGMNPERRARELSEEYNSAVTEMQQGLFGPSSDLPMSIRFSVSKSLPKARKECPVTSWRYTPITPSQMSNCVNFVDPSLPLAIDIGSGLGNFVLGMSEHSNSNWLGVDLQPVAVRYANAMASRAGVQGRVQFACTDAADVFAWIRKCYPGGLVLVCIQFPTPFRSAGNNDSTDSEQGSLVPASTSNAPSWDGSSMQSGASAGENDADVWGPTLYGKSDFMVQPALVNDILSALEPGGHLLVSSQLEHVARSLEEQFTSHSDFSMHVQNEHRSGSHNDGSNSVNDSLAQDDGPSSDSINISDSLVFGGTVSVCAESETEAACRRSGRPVYKTLLVKQ